MLRKAKSFTTKHARNAKERHSFTTEERKRTQRKRSLALGLTDAKKSQSLSREEQEDAKV